VPDVSMSSLLNTPLQLEHISRTATSRVVWTTSRSSANSTSFDRQGQNEYKYNFVMDSKDDFFDICQIVATLR